MKSNELLNETVQHQSSDATLVEKLPIFINGNEKYASGLTKRTTVDDVKYAMLSVAEPNFELDLLDDYAIFEKWQGNERILDGKIKIYKLIRLWKSLPGDQLSQVKFIIKKRKQQQPPQIINKLSARDANVEKNKSSNKFAFCTFSPAMDKTWNYEKAKRKSSLVRKQLNAAVQQENTLLSTDSSDNEYTRDESGTESDSQNFVKSNRYASIRRFNRSRKSTVRQTQQIKKSFIELVNRQNEIIDRQLENINQPARSRSKSLTKFFRSKSLDKCDKQKFVTENLDENDIKQAFASAKTDMNAVLDDKQAKEYSKLCKDYLKLQQSLNTKLQRIEDLKLELNEYQQYELEQTHTSKRLTKSIIKTNKKLQTSIDTSNMQSTKLNDLNSALTRIDDIICLKEKFIQSLEKELQRLDSSNKLNEDAELASYQPEKKSLAFTSESASSSTSSVLTSVSQQQPNVNYVKQSNKIMSSKYMPGDNESDTGISSANSEDYNTHLETLV